MKRKKKQIHFPVQHMYRYLYSYIFIYRRGRVLQNYIACVNQENLDKKTSKYTVWVVHKCFLSDYFATFTIRVTISTPTKQLTASRMLQENRSAHHLTNHARQSSITSVCVSPFSENRTGNVPTNSCTHTYTHIYTYTQTKYMASNVESRQLNKWHFSMFLF